MAAKTPEGKVKDRIKEILKDFNAHYQMQMTGGYGSSGDPDFSVCFQGLFIGIEAKADMKKNKPTALQKKRMEGIRRAGGLTFVIDALNVEQLVQWLQFARAEKEYFSDHLPIVALSEAARDYDIWYEECHTND